MGISKASISSPVEAGASLLDAKQLPLQITEALDYVSSRLARKRHHLTLVIVRRDAQIASPSSSPAFTTYPASHDITSPTRSLFGGSPTPLLHRQSSNSSFTSLHSASSNETSSSSTTSASLSRTQWASLPSSPKSSCASTPTSPSSSTSGSPAPSPRHHHRPTLPLAAGNPYGISLMPAMAMTPKAEKVLRQTVAKAERRFRLIGGSWLPARPLSAPVVCAATNELVRRSLLQNEVVFSGEGLTLLGLDRLHAFKAALHRLSLSSPSSSSPLELTAAAGRARDAALEDAVDELRRLVLARGGRPIARSCVLQAYAHVAVAPAALAAVDAAYRACYGGPERRSGVEGVGAEGGSAHLAMRTPAALAATAATKKRLLPALKTSFAARASSRSADEEIVERSPSTTPSRHVAFGGLEGITEASTEENEAIERMDKGPHRRGPMTPKGFEDITPVTRGEWCFLMVGEGWKGRRVEVETC